MSAEQALGFILENTTDYYVLHDRQGIILAANPAFFKITGAAPGDDLRAFLPDMNPNGFEAYVEKTLAQGSQRGMVQLIPPQGPRRICKFTSGAAASPGQEPRLHLLAKDLTHQVRAKEALSASEKRYRLLSDNIMDVLWTKDLSLAYTYISPSITAQRGFSVEEAMQLTLEDELTPDSLKRILEIHAGVTAQARQTGDWNRSVLLEAEVYCKDGGTIHTETWVRFVLDAEGKPIGLQGLSRDTTQRFRLERELTRQAEELTRSNRELEGLKQVLIGSRNKLKAVFDGLEDPIISLTRELKIESVNMAAAGLVQSHPRLLVGQPGLELLRHPNLLGENGDQIGDLLKVAEQTGKPQWISLAVPTGGDTSYFDVSIDPLSEKGEFILGIVHIKDISEFKRMEATIRRYSESLEEMVEERTAELLTANRELIRLDKLRQDLTAMVVHDMKSPLAELMGNLDLLTYGQLGDDQRETLDMALLGAQDLLRMIMNLLDINRLEEGKLSVRRREVAFKDLGAKITSRFATLIRLMNMRVLVNDQTSGPMQADPDLMERVLQNLFSNALEHTPEGGRVTLTCREAQKRDGFVIEVADTGRGIKPEALDRIFEKFSQADQGGGPRTSTGLGLTFCRLVAAAHGGDISVTSTPGQGSVFRVFLPRVAPEELADPDFTL